MKRVLCTLIVVMFIGCSNTQQELASHDGRLESVSESGRALRVEYEQSSEADISDTVTRNCSAIDFMKLANKELQAEFFSRLDSILKVQYPNDDREAETLVDLTPQLLNRFLKDIDKDSLIHNGKFEKEYQFNIAPPGFSDPKKCTDKISITYNEDHCGFRMVINSAFLVEQTWCIGHDVVYGFEIRDGRIIDFGRQAAG